MDSFVQHRSWNATAASFQNILGNSYRLRKLAETGDVEVMDHFVNGRSIDECIDIPAASLPGSRGSDHRRINVLYVCLVLSAIYATSSFASALGNSFSYSRSNSPASPSHVQRRHLNLLNSQSEHYTMHRRAASDGANKTPPRMHRRQQGVVAQQQTDDEIYRVNKERSVLRKGTKVDWSVFDKDHIIGRDMGAMDSEFGGPVIRQ